MLNKEKLQYFLLSTLKDDLKYDRKSQVWACGATLWKDIQADIAEQKKKWIGEQKHKAEMEVEKKKVRGDKNEKFRMTEEERAQTLSDLLDMKLATGEITASELRELKDIFNLKQKDQDIDITNVDYSEVDPETFDVISAVGEMIRRANATTDTAS